MNWEHFLRMTLQNASQFSFSRDCAMEIEAENLSVLLSIGTAGTMKCAFVCSLCLLFVNRVKSTVISVLLSLLVCEFSKRSLSMLC